MRTPLSLRGIGVLALLSAAACADTSPARPAAQVTATPHRDVTATGDQTASMICKLGPVGSYSYSIQATHVGTAGVFIDASGYNPSLTSLNTALNVTWSDVNQQSPKCTTFWGPTLGGGTTQLTITDNVPPGMRVDSVMVVDRHGSRLWTYGPGKTTVTWPDPTIPDPVIASKVVDDDHAGYEFRFFDSGDRGEVDFCKYTPTAPGTYNYYYSVSGGGPLMRTITPPGYFSLAVGQANAPTCADLIELPPGSTPATVSIVEFPRLGSDLQRWELFDVANIIGAPLNVTYAGNGAKSYTYQVSASYPQRRMLRTWDEPAPLPKALLAGSKEGCTPQFWGNRIYPGPWGVSPWTATGYDPGTSFPSVFGTTDVELDRALSSAVTLPSTYNNDVNAVFANDAVAALLNASSPNIKYGVSSDMVLSWARWAVGSGTLSLFNSLVEPLNQRSCPLP